MCQVNLLTKARPIATVVKIRIQVISYNTEVVDQFKLMKLCKFDFLTSSTRLQDPMHMTQ